MIPHYFHHFLCTLDVWEEGDSDSPPEKKKKKEIYKVTEMLINLNLYWRQK